MTLLRSIFIIFLIFMTLPKTWADSDPNRAVSFFISQDFINEQLSKHMKAQLIQKMSVDLDPEHGQIFLRGIIQVPTEELRAINLDPTLGKFRFQLAVHLEVTKLGHLILEFPLNETWFYPADSKTPDEDRVVIPVQLLSVALASARGYLAALSGDFSGFDRRTDKLKGLIKALDRSIKMEKNPDVIDDLKTQRESYRIQLEAVPIERKQLQSVAKEVESMMGFTGEKELSLNQDLAAKKNALILKVKISQMTPYLSGIELGGLRILHDKKDGGGQNYISFDIDADLPSSKSTPPTPKSGADRQAAKMAPSLIVRINQSLFESDAVLAAEKKQMGSKIKDFDLQLKDDGLHVTGKTHFLIFPVSFETIVDFVSTGPDVFEAKLREMKVAGMDFGFLENVVLESLKKRLDQSLKGICKFDFVGEESDRSHALRITVDPAKLVPAFPDLHLVDVDVREHEFLMKIGHADL